MSSKNKAKTAVKPTETQAVTGADVGAVPAAVTEGQAAPTNVVALPKIKPTKSAKVVPVAVPPTAAQIAAKEALAKADAEAQAELAEKSKGLLEPAQAAVTVAQEVLDKAKAELRAIQQAAGIVPVKAPRAERSTHGNATKFTFAKDLKDGLGGQQKQILEIIKANGADGISREELVKKMVDVIVTKMDHSRLLSFYTKPLSENGNVVLS